MAFIFVSVRASRTSILVTVMVVLFIRRAGLHGVQRFKLVYHTLNLTNLSRSHQACSDDDVGSEVFSQGLCGNYCSVAHTRASLEDSVELQSFIKTA